LTSLKALNRDLVRINVKKNGNTDWERTLEGRAKRAKMIIEKENLQTSHRFSWITGLIEKRMI
jgi:hypothetical protein